MAKIQVVFDMREMQALMKLLVSLTEKDKARACTGAAGREVINKLIETYGFMANAEMLVTTDVEAGPPML